MTRITQRTLSQTTMSNLNQSLARTAKLQEQLSTGKLVNRPSDSPTRTITAMQTRASLARNDSHQRAADDAQGWLANTDTALQGASSLLNRARDLVVQGQNTSTGAAGWEAIAREVEVLRDGLLELANTRIGGRLLFGGTADPSAAFDAAGTYLGDAGAVTRTVADGVQLEVNVVGGEAFGNGPGSAFDVLTKIADDLRTNPQDLVANNLGALDGARDRVLTALGGLGATMNRLDALQERSVASELNLKTRLSEAEDIDMPTTIMDLQMQEVAYQAALSATARVIQPSLLDFLR